MNKKARSQPSAFVNGHFHSGISIDGEEAAKVNCIRSEVIAPSCCNELLEWKPEVVEVFRWVSLAHNLIVERVGMPNALFTRALGAMTKLRLVLCISRESCALSREGCAHARCMHIAIGLGDDAIIAIAFA